MDSYSLPWQTPTGFVRFRVTWTGSDPGAADADLKVHGNPNDDATELAVVTSWSGRAPTSNAAFTVQESVDGVTWSDAHDLRRLDC